MRRKIYTALTVLLILCGSLLPAGAQWLTQSIVVSNGWTAAYLFVDASSQDLIPSTPGVPLAPGNPIDKIWLWKAPPSTAQYLITPASPLSAGGPWVSWQLTNAQNSLVAMIPNAAYLIHSASPTPYTWRIQGRPFPPHYTWDLTGLNFIGFATPTKNPPNFQSFLGPAPAISGIAQIYQYVGGELSTQPANPESVISPYYTPVNSGQAYWISATNVNNTYFGPFQITLPDPSGISFGINGGQMTFYVANQTPNTLMITMTEIASEPVPYGQTNIVGPPPLLVEGAQNPTNLTYSYTALSLTGGTNSMSWTLAPAGQTGSQVAITLGVNRYQMISAPPGSLYAAMLQFTDSLGFSSVNIPVAAESANNAGLWVGQVSVTNVSYDLKTYGTNSDGSLAMHSVTNAVVSTSTNNLVITTNLAVYNGVLSNLSINNYEVTNLYVNTYTTNGTQIVSNCFAISTNVQINYTIVTNTVIDTEAYNYYFTNGDQVVWLTTNYDYPPTITVQSNTSTQLVTNQLAVAVADGTAVSITNEITSTYAITSDLVTNAVFDDAVTNLAFATNYTSINASSATALAYNVVATNPVSGSFSTTYPPVAFTYSTTNLQVSGSVATNYYPASKPLWPLYEATNGNNLIYVNVETNNFLVTNVVITYNATNSLVISNNYTVNQGITNLVSVVTNVAYFQSSTSGTETTNAYYNLSTLVTTNRWKFSVTNYFATPASNYVITSTNTQGDAVMAPYPLRLIVFNDSNGNCSLLQRVYWGLDPNTNLIVSTSQTPLDPNQLSSARRITATHLPWSAINTPWAFSGGSLAQGALLVSAPIVENYDDQAANPFLHTYHPDHNNLDSQSPPHELPMGTESYQISRTISLSLMANTNDFISLTTAGSRLSGIYNESIQLEGLGGYPKNYQTIGSFSLTQISPVSKLTSE